MFDENMIHDFYRVVREDKHQCCADVAVITSDRVVSLAYHGV